MKNLVDLEKKINSELGTKINSSEIKHNQIYLEIDSEDLIDVVLSDLENSKYIDKNTETSIDEISILLSTSGIESIFTGPGFITISKTSELAWDNIIEDINSKLDNI